MHVQLVECMSLSGCYESDSEYLKLHSNLNLYIDL